MARTESERGNRPLEKHPMAINEGRRVPAKDTTGPPGRGWRAEEVIQWCRDRCEAKNEPIAKNRSDGIEPEAGLGSEERDQGQM